MRKSINLKALAVLSAVYVASGCTGETEFYTKDYSTVLAQEMRHNGRVWRIFDKPKEGRLMITPSFSAAAGAGIATGLTLGLIQSPNDKAATFKPAVDAYLSQKSESCRVIFSKLLIKPYYEFLYSC
ncbi:hypothetical protein JQX09_20695 [Sulfitobacter pseudonitzschiae]|uniref:Lipoprotein n=1 Tax=Pseudosulfitobacter pseudonitzschiae TaxID=1402135 RepID=A0A9Q2NLS9_9RHOB|nr:hypothetical protein [Pseudosulfitobacter pseudonitzschiae]MBM2294348.1 hypothetical protein [Pseudosulfitobacter pseudonitzschiae]MBM2299273.1 hypothetical protein [Pseudosulfitobacter pseudonitzschiae]MBM2313960.1 hypothetical protein [Pseudosulfitobacter pseudonitzschiae]MBM2318875.1 hypothetical protein [Pseudosulfitobacter pseudonitzschiae]MBM2328459.1 hypothetical protein [Pseudosulfitobacter pseudonitzschiae]